MKTEEETPIESRALPSSVATSPTEYSKPTVPTYAKVVESTMKPLTIDGIPLRILLAEDNAGKSSSLFVVLGQQFRAARICHHFLHAGRSNSTFFFCALRPLVNQKIAVGVLRKLGYGNVDIAENGLEVIQKLDQGCLYDVILVGDISLVTFYLAFVAF